MANITIINQPLDGQVGNLLIKLLSERKYNKFNASVAFAKNSGVLRLKQFLEEFRENGAEVNISVGIDLDGTSYEALTTLFTLADNLFVVHTESNQTFHPKVYEFTGLTKSVLIIGSNNMTAGGLWTNFETCAVIVDDVDDKERPQSSVSTYMIDLQSIPQLTMRIADQSDIDNLLREGYIDKEASIRIRRKSATNTHRGSQSKRDSFVYGVKAPLPHVHASTPHAASSSQTKLSHEDSNVPSQSSEHQLASGINESVSSDDQIMWFETRSMTGGSRNILDLSKTSLVAKGSPQGTVFYRGEEETMGGGVQFFGVDPNDEEAVKNIVINFDGVDYLDNQILYPKGSKANGTWRLQIRGVSSSNEKITRVLGKNRLVDKVIAFTKVNSDYYYMSIFDGSDLEQFEEASRIVAYNGGNRRSRLMGLL